jgi:hypothetical protein
MQAAADMISREFSSNIIRSSLNLTPGELSTVRRKIKRNEIPHLQKPGRM